MFQAPENMEGCCALTVNSTSNVKAKSMLIATNDIKCIQQTVD